MTENKNRQESSYCPQWDALTLAMAVTFGYATVAQAQMQASITKPALRTEYKSSGSISLDNSIDLNNGNP